MAVASYILWFLTDYSTALELFLYKSSTLSLKPLLALWSSVWIEWLALQVLTIYAFTRLYTSINYLRQVLAMM